MKAMPIRDNRDGAGKTIPDPEDFAAIEAEHGPLPHDATVQRAAERYRLAQARKLIRLWEQGKLPVELMREMDRIGAQGKGGRTYNYDDLGTCPDGELCRLAGGVTSFTMIQAPSVSVTAAPPVFFLLDLLYLDGKDLSARTLLERRGGSLLRVLSSR